MQQWVLITASTPKIIFIHTI